jgi:hypothetical protein
MATHQIWSFAIKGHADTITKFRELLGKLDTDEAVEFRNSVLEEQHNFVWFGEIHHWRSRWSQEWESHILVMEELCESMDIDYCYNNYTDATNRIGHDASSNGDLYNEYDICIRRPTNTPPKVHDLVVAPGSHVLELIPTEFVWNGQVHYGLRVKEWMDCLEMYVDDFPSYIDDPEEAFRQFLNRCTKDTYMINRIMENVAYPYPDGACIVRVGYRTLDPDIAEKFINLWKDGKLPGERKR